VAEKCKKFGVDASIFPFDLTKVSSISDLVKDITKKYPRINYLINNAGTYVKGDPYNSSLTDWDYALDLNFRSVYYLTNQVLPSMVAHESAVINISSIAGLITYKGGEIYTATKHALKAYSNCLFESVREKGIKVSCIFPGYVNTDLGRGENLDETKMIQPEDIAKTVEWILDIPITSCPTEVTIRPQFSPYK
jgi:NADP-dependent 3-hydroxy acid dehydrogenase YdfG